MEEPIENILTVPVSFILPERDSPEWWALYKQLIDRVKSKNPGNVDICAINLYELDCNLVLCYKAVPAWAPTMSSYPFKFLIVVKETLIEPLELQ